MCFGGHSFFPPAILVTISALLGSRSYDIITALEERERNNNNNQMIGYGVASKKSGRRKNVLSYSLTQSISTNDFLRSHYYSSFFVATISRPVSTSLGVV